MDENIQYLLRKLLDTQDPAEFEALSRELKTALHERVERLRQDLVGLKAKTGTVDRRKRPRDVKNKP